MCICVCVYPECWLRNVIGKLKLATPAVHRASLAELQSALGGKRFLAKLISLSGQDVGNERVTTHATEHHRCAEGITLLPSLDINSLSVFGNVRKV